MKEGKMSVTKEFAVGIDTQLSDLHEKDYQLFIKHQTIIHYIEFYEKEIARASVYYSEKNVVEQKTKLGAVILERAKVRAEIDGLNNIYNQTQWNRAFLVVSSDGHVHKNRYCSTCFDSTRYAWLVQYSNDEESTIVEDAGELACTVCYPSAPAEVLNRPSRIVTADKVAKESARIEREEKRQAKIAKAKASAPTASGNSIIINRGRYSEEIKTERSAMVEWNSSYGYANEKITTHYYDGSAHSQESIQHQKDYIEANKIVCSIIATALAGKHQITVTEQEAILKKKYAKRG